MKRAQLPKLRVQSDPCWEDITDYKRSDDGLPEAFRLRLGEAEIILSLVAEGYVGTWTVTLAPAFINIPLEDSNTLDEAKEAAYHLFRTHLDSMGVAPDPARQD